MTIAEVVRSDKFQKKLKASIDKLEGKYGQAKKNLSKGCRLKSSPLVRFIENGNLNCQFLTNAYLEVLEKSSNLSCSDRSLVTGVCEPILLQCISEHIKEDKEEEVHEQG